MTSFIASSDLVLLEHRVRLDEVRHTSGCTGHDDSRRLGRLRRHDRHDRRGRRSPR